MMERKTYPRERDTHFFTPLDILCLACGEGRFGYNCKHLCKCRNGGKCDHVSGTCTCKNGYTGKYCNVGE